MSNNKKYIKPFVTCVPDYHDFEMLIRSFSHAGFELDYTEIGCGYSDIHPETRGYAAYHAIFFDKRDADNDNIDKIRKEYELD